MQEVGSGVEPAESMNLTRVFDVTMAINYNFFPESRTMKCLVLLLACVTVYAGPIPDTEQLGEYG